MRHVVWIDIGTHEAQEYQAVFGSAYWFYFKVTKRIVRHLLASLRLVNSGRTKVKLGQLSKNRTLLRQNKHLFKFVFVEPNPHIITGNKVYQNADVIAQVALESSERQFALSKLYFGNGRKLSQGSSLYKNKHNVLLDSYQVVLTLDADTFFKELKRHLDTDLVDYDILIRINCEGAEDGVIYSAVKHFGDSIKLTLGSLKDVGQIKGPAKQFQLENFLRQRDLDFSPFSADVGTWANATTKILDLVDL